MPRHTAQRTAELSVVIPHGYEGFWQIIRKIDADRPWSITEIHGKTIGVKFRDTVADYIGRLVKGGFAKEVGERSSNFGRMEKTFRLLKRPSDAPSLTRGGSIIPPTRTTLIWNAIRGLKQFDIKELHYVTSQSHNVAPLTVKRYVQHLYEAGYFALVSEGAPGKVAIYRLRPNMNTGPLPPKILRHHLVWDENRSAVIHPAKTLAEEVTL